jgi:hypothetical protein
VQRSPALGVYSREVYGPFGPALWAFRSISPTLVKLDKLFLVDVYSYQPLPKGDPKGEYHPPSFAGWFTVFDGNGDVMKKRRVFQARDFHLTPAARCPDAPPAEP